MTDATRPSGYAFALVAACREVHHWEGLCPECVDSLLTQRDADIERMRRAAEVIERLLRELGQWPVPGS